jgi:two-component system, OmpR family, alkaline phosphatase synthesis response regulator PhoP
MISERLQQFADRARRAFHGHVDESPRVLCADDDESTRVLCAAALTRSGFEVDMAANGREAIDQIEKVRYSAVLLDLGMPHIHGTTVLSMIRKTQPDLLQRVVVITGAADAALLGTDDVRAILRKPFGTERLLAAVHDCCGLDETVRVRGNR